MPLFADLDAFYLEHKRCGDLDSGLAGDQVKKRRSMNRRAFVTGLGGVPAVRQILAAQRVTEPLGPSSPGGASTMAT